MLGGGLAEQSGLAPGFQSETLAIDVDENGVVKDPIEHRHGEHSVAGEGAIPGWVTFQSATLDQSATGTNNAVDSISRSARIL